MPLARVTLASIAAHTGLSKFAISRALSGKGGVSEQTRQRVIDAAKALGYSRPQTSVEARIISVVFLDTDLVNSELHMLIQSGVQHAAQKLGYQVNMRWTHLPDQIEAIARTSHGMMLVGPHDRGSMNRAYATGIPIVRVGWLDPLEPVDQVSGTDHEAGAAVANYLVGLGHRSIVYVHGAPGYRGRIERWYGVREVLEGRPDVDFRQMRAPSETWFTEGLLALQAGGFKPTALFCGHDGMAVTVVSELLRLGYRIPEDISVVGFGDYSSATQISPHLTTVHVHGTEIGVACVRLIDDRLTGRIESGLAMRIQIASKIISRASSGPAPAVAVARGLPDAPLVAGA
ncbi:MAG TPA: LacI family DNA-binding transcriptional regulator [Devosia sp.]|nr:LacI family DNA-binding transcriptional regulator [Devosia sp.]